MRKPTLYHNPNCSKSRAVKALLDERGMEAEIIEYLQSPPSLETLQALAEALATPIESLVRRADGDGLDGADADRLLSAVAADPARLQRPILVVGDRAVIGRPPEAVLSLLEAPA